MSSYSNTCNNILRRRDIYNEKFNQSAFTMTKAIAQIGADD